MRDGETPQQRQLSVPKRDGHAQEWGTRLDMEGRPVLGLAEGDANGNLELQRGEVRSSGQQLGHLPSGGLNVRGVGATQLTVWQVDVAVLCSWAGREPQCGRSGPGGAAKKNKEQHVALRFPTVPQSILRSL